MVRASLNLIARVSESPISYCEQYILCIVYTVYGKVWIMFVDYNTLYAWLMQPKDEVI